MAQALCRCSSSRCAMFHGSSLVDAVDRMVGNARKQLVQADMRIEPVALGRLRQTAD